MSFLKFRNIDPENGESAYLDAQIVANWNEFRLSVADDKIPGHSIVTKFGHALVGTDPVPITTALTYQTPATPVALEAVSDNANDTALGTGARSLRIGGLNGSWDVDLQDVPMNGLIPAPIPNPIIRLPTFGVNKSGSYATEIVPSTKGKITIQEVVGKKVWAELAITPFPVSQSEIAVDTIPRGFRAYVFSAIAYADAVKSTSIYFFQRPKADVITAPFEPMRIIQRGVGIAGAVPVEPVFPRGPFIGPCDIGYLGHVTGATEGDVSIRFEILLIKDGY